MNVDANVLADTVLRDHAHAVLNKLDSDIKNSETRKRLSRSQIRKLHQVAKEQPEQVHSYAKHQFEKIVPGRDGYGTKQSVANVWQTIIDVTGSAERHAELSILALANPYLPVELSVADQPLPKGATIEQRQERKKLKKRRNEKLEWWAAMTIPLFFDHFCINLICSLPSEKQS